jgi:hypothetical protein
MEIILLPLFIIIFVFLGSVIDDKLSGRHYKSDAEKTEEDWRKERELEEEMHRITWE